MKEKIVSPQYLHIAQDLAARIVNGELSEGARVYGRSLMASEYNVSPETIRRALRLLVDMKVVEVKPQSGVTVLSLDNARRYLENFSETTDVQALRVQMKELLAESAALHQRMEEVATALFKSRERFASAAEPLPNYEIPVPQGSPLVGKSIGETKFWQSTGSTIVAIRRLQRVILSPGPFAEFYGGDVIIVVGNSAAVEAAHRLVTPKE